MVGDDTTLGTTTWRGRGEELHYSVNGKCSPSKTLGPQMVCRSAEVVEMSGGSESLRVELEFRQCPLPFWTLLPNYRLGVTTCPVLLHPYLPCQCGLYPLELPVRTSLKLLLLRSLVTTRWVTYKDLASPFLPSSNFPIGLSIVGKVSWKTWAQGQLTRGSGKVSPQWQSRARRDL